MDFELYRIKGKETVDYIADYLENIRERRVFPDVIPGYIRELLPKEAPQKGEEWDEIFKDVERVIMPGVTHWQSPHMHAYFPALNSFPSLIGDMVSDAINCLSFTWAASPAATELESLVMDWLVKALGLPEKFLISNQEPFGGGVLQTSVSESTYYALLAARTKMFHKYGVGDLSKYIEKSEINGRLVCYCSDQAHSSVEKSALVAITRIHVLPTDENLVLRGETLKNAIEKDKKDGLIPFFVCCTLGTTGACAFDSLEEIGPICKEEDIWLHIDAAYAGSAFLCPEYRHFLKGIENATSFVFNPSKWLLTNFDCTCFWVESSIYLHQTFTVAPLYLKHKYSGDAIDYMHWQVGLSRRFRSLKLWFVLRSFGIEGLQKHVRKGAELGSLFEKLVLQDDRFEILAKRHLGLIVFRLKGEDEITEQLLKQLNKEGKIHLVPAKVKNKYIIRFTVTSYYTTEQDIYRDWHIIQETASVILKQIDKEKLQEKIRQFQSSLVTANAVQTPKIVNASFLAFFPDSDFALPLESARLLTNHDYTQSHLPLTPRRKPRFLIDSSQKMLSLDEFSKSLPNPKFTINGKNRLNVMNVNGQEINYEKSLDDSDAYKKEQDNQKKNKSNKKEFTRQTSLDSKIEHIFEEAETSIATVSQNGANNDNE